MCVGIVVATEAAGKGGAFSGCSALSVLVSASCWNCSGRRVQNAGRFATVAERFGVTTTKVWFL